MDKMPKSKRTVPNIINTINETNDESIIARYENMLVCIFASPLMFLGASANFLFRYLIWHEALTQTLLDSIIFLILGISFEIFSRVSVKPFLFTHIISIFFAFWITFIVIRYYDRIGPAVWTVAFIQIILSMTRINRVMLTYVLLTTFLAGVYLSFWYEGRDYQMSLIYYVAQALLFGILLVITTAVHNINFSRYKKVREQFKEVYAQKEEIIALYEELASTEEELRDQNSRLQEYNQVLSKSEERYNYLAYFDALTELPNRKMVMDRLNLLIQSSKERDVAIYVVFIDVDNFKKINDTKGHYVGDRYIKAIANNMRDNVHKDDLLGRIGGDEFALIICREVNEDEVFQYVNSIRETLMSPFFIENREFRSTASFGISVFPRDGRNADELLICSDTSMYKAKDLGKNNVQFFRKYMKEEIVSKVEMENRLINALENNEFFLVFQPQFYLKSYKIRGFEALIRWRSPELGIVPPNFFIPLAEETRLIIPLGEWVICTACEQFKNLIDKYMIDSVLSVNISAKQIMESKFVETLDRILSYSGVTAQQLEIEITESVFIESFNDIIPQLERLKKMGVKIALDDFGTGYSSLSYLRQIPLDTLKIDKSFISSITLEDASGSIVGDIISLAHNIGVSVIAEGVEKSCQLEYLESKGCDSVQGFLLSKPVECELLDTIIEDHLK